MTREGHPSDLELARWAEGGAASLAEHLSACDPCAERAAAARLAAGAEAGEEDRARADLLFSRLAAPAGRPSPRLWRAAALAAAGLLAAWGLRFWSGGPAGAPAFPSGAPAVLPAAAGEGLLVEAADVPVERTLPDGSRLRAAPGTRLSFSADPRGGRLLRIKRGAVELDVRKDRTLFTVSAAGGDVIVTGTRFTARAFRLEPRPGGAFVPVLSVEVREGSVRLRSPGGTVDLAPGQTGIAAGQAPVRFLDAAGRERTVEAALARLAEASEGAADAALLGAAATALGTWDDPAAFLREESSSADPRRRAAAAALARLARLPTALSEERR